MTGPDITKLREQAAAQLAECREEIARWEQRCRDLVIDRVVQAVREGAANAKEVAAATGLDNTRAAGQLLEATKRGLLTRGAAPPAPAAPEDPGP